MSVKVKLWSAFVLVAGVIISLITVGVVKASSFYVTVNEVQNKNYQQSQQQITVSGQLIGDTVDWQPSQNLLKFSIQDTSGTSGSGPILKVVYHGEKPSDFSNGWPIIVTGQFLPDKTLSATQLLVKCPSKYEAKQ